MPSDVGTRATSITSPARSPLCTFGPVSSTVASSPASGPVVSVTVAVRQAAVPDGVSTSDSHPWVTASMVACS